MIFSRVLAIGDRRDIGLYEVPRYEGLEGFWIGMILAVFQIEGIWFLFRAMLNICVKYVIARLPKCFRCWILI